MLARPAPSQSLLFLSLARWNSVVLWETVLLGSGSPAKDGLLMKAACSEGRVSLPTVLTSAMRRAVVYTEYNQERPVAAGASVSFGIEPHAMQNVWPSLIRDR